MGGRKAETLIQSSVQPEAHHGRKDRMTGKRCDELSQVSAAARTLPAPPSGFQAQSTRSKLRELTIFFFPLSQRAKMFDFRIAAALADDHTVTSSFLTSAINGNMRTMRKTEHRDGKSEDHFWTTHPQRDITDRTQQQANKNTPYQVRCPTPGHLAGGEVARDDSDFGEEIYESIYNKNNNNKKDVMRTINPLRSVSEKIGFLPGSVPPEP